MARTHNRTTKDGIHFAGLRRWDGRARITTTWVNLHNDPELCFPDGDCLVYLHEPGQSNRGPSFRLHSSHLAIKGFQCLVDRCIGPSTVASCANTACRGCERPHGILELYLPAPANASKESSLHHHLATRNLFAWLYNVPLAGKALGKAVVGVLERINVYRPGHEAQNRLDIVSYVELQRYLDFRECADHALAALHFAESFEMEDLWVDAFAHCVGLNHCLHESLEYKYISPGTKALVNTARLEMDVRLDRVSRSLLNFFEFDLSAAFLGLHPAAREHFDRFRSFLHAYYIEMHGFWPPANFDSSPHVQRLFYRSMYADFRSLYQYLVDPSSTTSMADNKSLSGGLCILQNVKAFDERHRYEPLPHPLPLTPSNGWDGYTPNPPKSRRNSLTPIWRRKAERELRNAKAAQSLIDSSNRDWALLRNLLVRRYEDFERQSILDEYEDVSLIDGRKVRWILIYAVLQTLVSVTHAPREVRDPEGLSYPLCCHPPKVMPWRLGASKPSQTAKAKEEQETTELKPDNYYSHTNSSSSSLGNSASKKERRKSLSSKSVTSSRPRVSESSSFRRLLNKRSMTGKSVPLPKPAFCEIFVPGYGNGLNEAKTVEKAKSEETITEAEPERPCTPTTPTTLVSRESSKASGYSRSTDTDGDAEGLTDMDHLSVDGDTQSPIVLDEKNEMHEVHFNTSTWDAFLG